MMTCYRKTVFADDDTSSIGSIQFNEATANTTPATIHIRYHTGRVTAWDNRTKLEKILIIGSVLITVLTLICISVIFHLAHFIMQQPAAVQCNDTALTNTTASALFMTTPNELSTEGTRVVVPDISYAKKFKAMVQQKHQQKQQQKLQDFQALREQSSRKTSTSSKIMELKQIISDKMMKQQMPQPKPPSAGSASVIHAQDEIIYGRRTTVPNGKSRPRPQLQYSYTKSICLTESCIHAASDMLHSMDRSINPCIDFYGFACNQWLKKNPIPEGRAVWGTFTKLEQQNQLVIKTVLEHPNEQFKSNAELKAKYYYESCMDDEEIVEKLGAEPLLNLIDNVGGWNVTQPERFDISKWSLQQTLTKLQNQYNMGGFFAWDVGENDRDSKHYVLQIDQGGLSLPTRDNYLNVSTHAKILTAYLDYMKDIARLLNVGGIAANELEPQVVDQLKAIIEFETKIAEITIPAENRRDEEKLYHIMTIKELEELSPFLDWTKFFNESFQIINRTIRNDEHVVVYAKDYLKNLSTLITQYGRTDEGKNTLNNYMMWQTVRTYSTYLSKPFRNAYKNLHKALAGVEGNEEQWRSCVADTNTVMGFAVGAMFVRDVFHGNAKPLAEDMINDIRDAFKHSLSNLKWMDAETRELAIDKADAITDMIGFPEYILKPDELDAKYNDLSINRSEYFGNNVRLGVYNLKRNLEKLYQTVNKTVWGMSPSTVNAYYAPTKNQIVFPAGILQLPFYDIENPQSLNYGAMGVVMGHELIHAFDDQGREFDKNGNLYKWWKNTTIDRFNERAKCFQKQYDNYQVNHIQINGKSTLGENIADNGGLKASYNAYIALKNIQQRDNDEYSLQLPGLNMTNEQLFFLSFAQVWCSSVTNETSKLQIEKDPHAPPRYRVIGALSNLPEFSEAFDCPLGSPMNPVDKCEMW